MRLDNRFHPADGMAGLRELEGFAAPAVVVRPDGSLDVYGPVSVVDQRDARPTPAVGDRLHLKYDPRYGDDCYAVVTEVEGVDFDVVAEGDELESAWTVLGSEIDRGLVKVTILGEGAAS